MSFDPSLPPLISETLLKGRRSLEDLAFKRSLIVPALRKRKRTIRGEDIKIKRPEDLVREFRTREGSLNKMKRLKRQAERRSSAAVPKSEMKTTIGFMVRIHEARHSSREIKDQLRKLGLHKKYDGRFVKLDDDSITKLKALDTYIAYGYLSHQAVIDLIHRHAYTSSQGPRRPLNDNIMIEKLLGQLNILCVNDLAHEIYTVGPHYDEAVSMLCTFKLAAPVGKFDKNILNVHDEVEKKSGFIGSKIEEFLQKIA